MGDVARHRMAFRPRHLRVDARASEANGPNVAEAVARQGPDDLSTPIYRNSQKAESCPTGYPAGE